MRGLQLCVARLTVRDVTRLVYLQTCQSPQGLATTMTASSQSSGATAADNDQSKYWKEVGYRGFSTLLASDNDFLIFRRFGALNARLLLYLQDEIAVLEDELRRLEKEHADPAAKDIHNGSFRREVLPIRKALLESISKKVRDYSKLSSSAL
jgi:hypothetical protein